jgi:hypothetical protein
MATLWDEVRRDFPGLEGQCYLNSQIDNLKVAARTSSFSFKGRDVDVATIGERLGDCHGARGQRPQVRKPATDHRSTRQYR